MILDYIDEIYIKNDKWYYRGNKLQLKFKELENYVLLLSPEVAEYFSKRCCFPDNVLIMDKNLVVYSTIKFGSFV